VKLFVIGDVTVDHLYFLERIPRAGEEAMPIRSTLIPGGAGGSLAYYAAQLGHQVTLGARVGNDPFQEVALSKLKAVGVDLSAIQKDENTLTSTITIMVTPDAERSMISAGGANRNLDAAELPKKVIEESDAMILSAYALVSGMQREYTVKAMQLAQKQKIPIFIDLGTGAVNTAGTKLLEIVKSADYLLMNQLELARITGQTSISDALEGLHAQGVHNVVVKVGSMGAIVWTPEESELIEGYEIDGVADSTGAGDGFTAAFAHAILLGYDMKRAAQYANVVGALVATNIGAQSAKISHQNILERVEERYGKEPSIAQKSVDSPKPAKVPSRPVQSESLKPEPIKPQAMPEPLLIEPPAVSKPEVVKEAPAKETPVKKTRVKAKV
jgi:ribokinase